MYLSRLILNPRNRRVQSELASLYEMHRTLSRSFAEGLGSGDERFLFRVDRDIRSGVPHLVIQSRTIPDWSWLKEPNANGYLLDTPVENPASKAFDPQFQPGQVLTFRLRANPTKKLSLGRNNKRVGLYGEEEQLEWLQRKAEQGGFQILSAYPRQDDVVTGAIHRGNGDAHQLKLLAVTFDGILRVADPGVLRQTLETGIGSGKAFGFGLLSLAPAH